MEEKSHLNPPTQATKHRYSDEQFVTIKPFDPHSNDHHTKRSSKCLVYVLFLIVLLSIAFLILGTVVLRIKNPTIRLSHVAIRDLKYDSASLNATFFTEIRLHNMNYGSSEFRHGSMALLYEDTMIGSTNINYAKIGIREKKVVNVTMKVMTGNINNYGSSENFSRDINLGLLKLRSYAKLRGEVRVIKIINRYRTAVMNCTMLLNLTGQVLQDLSCF